MATVLYSFIIFVVSWYDVVLITLTSLIGMFGVSVGLQGYAFSKVPLALRIVSAVGGVLLIIPETITDIIGLVLVVGVCVLAYFLNKRKPATIQE